ncbi:hypothetical protein [Prosthecobacter fusiformis]|uniref:hypothetical protein n=1 Tax=Prosthecobacter fusiformis TaxID=48464 RepID=UPI0010614932|nr:hypothetical protein [Prosthecobacter fusiformis]
MSEVPPSPRQLFHLLDTGSITPEQFRESMAFHAREVIEEMEEDHLNPAAAFVEQMLCRRAAAKLLKHHEETLVREVLLALSELSDFPPGRWLWNAGHPHIPLHTFFRIKREPVFRMVSLDAAPQVVTVVVEYGAAGYTQPKKEEFRLRRDRRNQLGLERRRMILN